MFVTLNQLYVFLACFAFGGAAGTVFSLSALIFAMTGKRAVKTATDLLACFLTTALYVFFSYALNFPSLRLYMPVGVFLGIVCYMKTFHILLAKMLKRVYNKIHIKNTKRDDL